MCGIGAIFGKRIKNKKFSIKRNLDVVKHRGYSNFEIEVFDKAVLGANRLEIIDRDKAKQPISNEDKTVFVELNQENNRSSDHIEDPRRRSYDDRRSYGSNRSYGDNRSSGGYGGRSRDNQSSSRRRRW